MASDIFYSKTAAGKAEAAATPGKLPAGMKTLLGLVDNSTVTQLKRKLPQVPVDKLIAALDRLFADGYIEIALGDAAPAPAAPAAPPTPAAPAAPAVPAATAAPAASAPPDAKLDFANFIKRPVKEPTIQKLREAEATLSGIRSTKKAGYFVHIINRASKRVASKAGGDKYTVLVIDADQANAMVVTRALLLAKFETRAAALQNEIIEQLNKQPPADVIAMDMVLPETIGLELLGRLRDHPVYKTTPIIVMATKAEHDDVVAALAYGASGYMTKPFKPETLVDSVQAVLGL
jgi:CheY-like chemotaxis protein